MNTMTKTIQINDDTNVTRQHSSWRRILRRRNETITAVSLALLVGCFCFTISCCAAFHITHNPYSSSISSRSNIRSGNARAFVRPHATTGAEEDVSSESGSEPPSSSNKPATPPPINGFDRQEFEMQVGRAMDTLRDDYPRILSQDPGKFFSS